MNATLVLVLLFPGYGGNPPQPSSEESLLIESVAAQVPAADAKWLNSTGRFADTGLLLEKGKTAALHSGPLTPWFRAECLLQPDVEKELEVRWTFELEKTFDVSIVLQRKRQNDQFIDTIRFVETRPLFPTTIREYSGPELLGPGNWTLEYRFGTISCTSPVGVTHRAFVPRDLIGYGPIGCNSASLSVSTGQIGVGRVRLAHAQVGPVASPAVHALRTAGARLLQLEAAGQFSEIAKLLNRIDGDIRSVQTKPPADTRLRYMVGDVLGNFGSNYESVGRYEDAHKVTRLSLDLLQVTAGEHHPNYTTNLTNLSLLYSSLGDYSQAIPVLKRALEIDRALVGEMDVDYGISVHNLAVLYSRIGDYAQAERLYRQSLEIDKHHFGTDSPHYATTLHGLGILYVNQGKVRAALPLLTQASDVRKRKLGDDRVEYASSLQALGIVHQRLGDDEKAEACLERCTAICRREYGARHPEYADALASLGSIRVNTGRFVAALPPLLEARQIRETVLGRRHGSYLDSLHQIAAAYDQSGEPTRAEPLLAEAVAIGRENLRTNSVVQSERQQRRNAAIFRVHLDRRITNAFRAGIAMEKVIEDCWSWKGAVTARQRAYRQLATNPALAPLFEQLSFVSKRLSVVSSQAPVPPADNAAASHREAYVKNRAAWKQTFTQLTAQREQIEQRIAAASEDFRSLRNPVSVSAIRTALPADTALVDFLEYNHAKLDPENPGKPRFERRFAVFVVTGNRQPVALSLVASELDDAVRAFREQFEPESPAAAGAKAQRDPAQVLRTALWQPVEDHLAGITTVVISPDTTLGRLPFAALPSRTSGRYLLEDYRIASVPMASLLTRLTAREVRPQRGSEMLLVGDVDYGAASSGPQPSTPLLAQRTTDPVTTFRGGTNRNWESLPGFRGELDTIAEIRRSRFPGTKLQTLTGQQATEAQLLKAAASAKTLHLITHGYFEPEPAADANSAARGGSTNNAGLVAEYSPGLLSGLVLAGANNSGPGGRRNNDGILRASEIEAAALNDVDLVVLSACETGLGAVAGGEGLTGLQRAFQIAGARSVVASLWKVDDKATQELMRVFYENLWIRQQSKLDALRNAQLHVLRNPVLADGTQLRGRPVKTRQPVVRTTPDSTTKRSHPAYWAAWTLSGDWQ